ncbi:MAG: hypothetical protein AAGH15_00475 [Myxococcota bacterium]
MKPAVPVLLLSLACAHGAPPPPAYVDGDPAGPPALEAMPAHPAGGRPPGMSETMVFAWTLSEQAFDLPDPPPAPMDPTVAAVEAWTAQHLQPWLGDKNRMVEAARRELDVAADEIIEQRIVAGALVGLLYEDVARVLLSIPVPQEIADEEPEIREAYEYVVESQAEPFLAHSRAAYRACAGNSRVEERFAAFERFCSQRRANLPLTRDERAEGTVLEVIRE